MKPTPSNSTKPTFTHEMSDEDKTMPLGVGDAAPEDQGLDPLAGAGEARRLRSGSLLLVVVVVIACAGLWFMRSLSHVSAAGSGKNEIEKSIEDFLGAREKKQGKDSGKNGTDPGVLAVLSASYKDRQVPLDSVKQNPFILPGEGDTPAVVTTVKTPNSDAAMAQARAARQKDIDAAAGRLTIKSIMFGSQPLANISGTIVRIGDEVTGENSDVTFRVTTITSDTVTLVAEDLALGMHVEVPLSMHHDK